MISPQLKDMTVAQLQARIRIHESTAQMFDDNKEHSTAEAFRELAGMYAAELARRTENA